MVPSSNDIGGLCHLVEAATALSSLIELPNSSPQSESTPERKCVVSDDDDEESCRKNGSRCKREFFPHRLMAILSDKSLTEIVSWLPNGRSFVVIRPDVFIDEVVPKYLPPVDARASTKYPSFTRKLNRWGFRQVTRGTNTGAFHHPLFIRDQPNLCIDMVCQRSSDRKSGKNSNLPPKKRVLLGSSSSKTARQRTIPKDRLRSLPLNSPGDRFSPVSDNSAVTEKSVSSSEDEKVFQSDCSAQSRSPIEPDESVVHTSVPDEGSLLEQAFRRSQEDARIRAAQAMLYASYLKALQG